MATFQRRAIHSWLWEQEKSPPGQVKGPCEKEALVSDLEGVLCGIQVSSRHSKQGKKKRVGISDHSKCTVYKQSSAIKKSGVWGWGQWERES